MVLPPFIVKGGFLLASILFRVLAGPHRRWAREDQRRLAMYLPPFSIP